MITLIGGDFMEKLNAVGIGFAGIDIIKSDNELIMTGGTCGNVMSALASLNWNANIIKNCYNDYWNQFADSLWRLINVNIVNCGVTNHTLPRIVEVVDGRNNPHYSSCPICGTKLIEVSLPSRPRLKSLEIDFSEYDILFYDRIADGTKFLLDMFLEHNKWTFYEPNSVRNYDTWVSNILSCHIAKFSGDRIPEIFWSRLIEDLNCRKHNTKIVLITHSNNGYSYSIANGEKMTELKRVNVNSFAKVVDSTGAGDWLSAGFINMLVKQYKTPIDEIDEQIIIDALSFGHLLAENACTYVGALGKLFSDKNIELPEMEYACDFCKSLGK